MKNERIKGYIFVILSAVLYGMYPIASKFAYSGGATPTDLLLLKGTALLPLALMGFLNKKTDMRIEKEGCKKTLLNIAVLAAAGAVLTPLLLLTSYTLIPAGTATVIHYSYCALTLVICVVIYKDKLDPVKLLCVMLCLSGVFLLYSPKVEGSLTGMLVALASAFTFAFYTVFLDKSGLHSMGPVKLQFYILCVSVPVSVIYAAVTNTFSFKMSAPAWGAALAYYMIGAALASVFFQMGVHRIGPERSAILSTIEPLTSVILGVTLFGEELTWRSAAGMAVIIAAAVFVTAADSLRAKRTPR